MSSDELQEIFHFPSRETFHNSPLHRNYFDLWESSIESFRWISICNSFNYTNYWSSKHMFSSVMLILLRKVQFARSSQHEKWWTNAANHFSALQQRSQFNCFKVISCSSRLNSILKFAANRQSSRQIKTIKHNRRINQTSWA